MYLFFDTETANLPTDYNAPVTNTRNWPRIVQIGWIACQSIDEVIAREEHLVKPVGFSIKPAATEVHGITTAHALAAGEDLEPVLAQFAKAVASAKTLVGHNISFDERVIGAEFIRAGMPNVLPDKRRVCTMKKSVDLCQLPGRYGYKWPTLTELHRKLFHEPFTGAHGALADCEACRKCYFRLRELGVVS